MIIAQQIIERLCPLLVRIGEKSELWFVRRWREGIARKARSIQRRSLIMTLAVSRSRLRVELHEVGSRALNEYPFNLERNSRSTLSMSPRQGHRSWWFHLAQNPTKDICLSKIRDQGQPPRGWFRWILKHSTRERRFWTDDRICFYRRDRHLSFKNVLFQHSWNWTISPCMMIRRTSPCVSIISGPFWR